MSDTTIRLSEAAKARLDLHKRAGESYEDVILRLTERDRWARFGALSDAEADTATGMERVREEMRDRTADRIGGSDGGSYSTTRS